MESITTRVVAGELRDTLDLYHERLAESACTKAIDEMIRELGLHYDAAAKAGALSDFRATCQTHPLHELALQDPFTQRAFSKPRGYAGDAVMLDYIYRPSSLELTEVGAAIYQMTTGVSAAKSITWRRDHLGEEIAKTAARVENARVLSVASGHLRELDVVRKLLDRPDFGIVALDQDAESLEEAVNSNPDFNITPVNKSIAHLFKGHDQTEYDLIYSAGLFDYLPNQTAAGLLTRLISMLTPAGRLIVGNYTPENYGRGYMEGMMGWSLIYRNEADMEALLETQRERRVYRDDTGNVVYLEVSPHWN
ncbi:extracellular factor (EF) 3-hydroxypalmitic acid methyl ester biosynthesis protein [Bradyrhizobium sp. USDA 4341]